MKVCPMCVVAAAGILGFGGFAFIGGAGARATPAPASPQAAADTYTVDAVHSHVGFKVMHQKVAYSYGRFNDFSGTFAIDPAAPEATAIDITVKATTVDTANAKRDEHLRSPDFFSVKEFEIVTFKSKSSKAGGAKDTIDVTGDLTFRGVTKPITVPVTFTGKNEGRGGKLAGLETTFIIKRSEYGMNYMPGGLGEDVTLMISLEGGLK